MRPIQFALATLLLMTAAQANAALQLETTVDLTNPATSDPELTRAVFDWETTRTSGTANINDLLNWTLRLFNGNSLVYTDVIIDSGVVQPIAGNARFLPDLIWFFQIDNMELLDVDNDGALAQADPGATGTTYNVYTTGDINTPAVFNVVRYQDGTEGNGNGWDFETRSVPIAPTALLLLAGLPLLRRRRRSAASGDLATA